MLPLPVLDEVEPLVLGEVLVLGAVLVLGEVLELDVCAEAPMATASSPVSRADMWMDFMRSP